MSGFWIRGEFSEFGGRWLSARPRYLEGAGIPAVVVGVSMSMDGGIGGVPLLVPEDRIEAARKVLKDLEECR